MAPGILMPVNSRLSLQRVCICTWHEGKPQIFHHQGSPGYFCMGRDLSVGIYSSNCAVCFSWAIKHHPRQPAIQVAKGSARVALGNPSDFLLCTGLPMDGSPPWISMGHHWRRDSRWGAAEYYLWLCRCCGPTGSSW